MDTHEERKHLAAHCDPVKCIGHDNSTSQSHWFSHFLLRVQFLPSHIFVLAHPCSFLPICSSLTSGKTNHEFMWIFYQQSSIGSPNNFGEFSLHPCHSTICRHRSYKTVVEWDFSRKIQFSLSIVKRLVRLMWFFFCLSKVLVLLLRRAVCHIMLCACVHHHHS